MLFVMLSILIFVIPWILLLLSVIDVRSGKRKQVNWKLPLILLIVLASVGTILQIFMKQTYGFPIFANIIESIIATGISIFIPIVMVMINLVITKTLGKNAPSSVHDPKLVNRLALCFFAFFFTVLFLGAPIGKKIGFAYSIEKAMKVTNTSDTEEFSVALVSSEQECLKRTASCRSSDYSNQFFIRNHLNKTQEVQVKIRVLDQNNQEVKVIDSKIMELHPQELRLVETEETREDSSIWNQYSFKTTNRIFKYEHLLRYREPMNH